jgi:signal transduction histidine kinase
VLTHDLDFGRIVALSRARVPSVVTFRLGDMRAAEVNRQLAELDRTKTEFFANISHEFRTPLTLMLAPLDDLLRRRAELPPALGDEVEVAANNARRLLRLVDSLLDFSQIETGARKQYVY